MDNPKDDPAKEPAKDQPVPKIITPERELEILREIAKRADIHLNADSNAEQVWGEAKMNIEKINTSNPDIYASRKSHFFGQFSGEIKSQIKKQFALPMSVSELKELPIDDVLSNAYNQFAGKNADAENLRRGNAELKDELAAKNAEIEATKAEAERDKKLGRIELEFERAVSTLPIIGKNKKASAKVAYAELSSEYQISLNTKGELDIRNAQNELPYDSALKSQLSPLQVIERYFNQNGWIENNNSKKTPAIQPIPQIEGRDEKMSKAKKDALENANRMRESMRNK